MCTDPRISLQRGLSLVELIIFIVVVSVGVVGILGVFNLAVRGSGDPLVQKQAQALADGLLEEVMLGLFAYCDGADPNVYYATSAALCTTPDSFGPEAGETRPYDTVLDYVSGYNTATAIAATDMSGTIAAPSGYTATVTVDNTLALPGVAVGNALRIRVAVTGPGQTAAQAEGIRTRQVPR